MPKITMNGTSVVPLMPKSSATPPTQRFFASITIERDPAATGNLCIGWPGQKEGAVTTADYDVILTSSQQSATLDGEPGSRFDAARVYVVPTVSGEGGNWFGGNPS